MEAMLELGITVFVLSGLGLALGLIVYGLWGLWQCWQPVADQHRASYPPVRDSKAVREAELIVEQYLHQIERENDARP